MEDYKEKLLSHDWFYDYSDDHRVWTAGKNSFAQLKEMQKIYDPHYFIWNEYCPDQFIVKS